MDEIVRSVQLSLKLEEIAILCDMLEEYLLYAGIRCREEETITRYICGLARKLGVYGKGHKEYCTPP